MTKESAAARIERLKAEKAAAKQTAPESTDIVGQLTHESDGKPDYEAIAQKLVERKEAEAKGENEGHVKMTVYVEETIAKAFNALCIRRGDQKRLLNEALADFIHKKARELEVE